MNSHTLEDKVRCWLSHKLSSQVQATLQRIADSEGVVQVAVMPDVHLSADVCIGTVVATTRMLYPNAVGGDIGCGMAALGFDASASVLRHRQQAARLLTELARAIPVLKHRGAQALPDHLSLRSLSDPSLEKIKAREGVYELGTLGRGNHFVEMQRAEDGQLWLMVHTGSRAMGQALRDHHLRAAPRSSTGLACVDAESLAGTAYLSDVEWALSYAEANRRAIVDRASEVVAEVLDAYPIRESYLSCHHNHVIAQTIGDRQLWVHRKGAISAQVGEAGLIPGSMGTRSFHVEGRGEVAALLSSSHGAGRAMSRSDAKRRFGVRALQQQLDGVWFDHRLSHRLVDEAPQAYKDIDEVMRAQRELTKVVRTLQPVLVFKGG